MNQEPQPFILGKQLILLPIFWGDFVWRMGALWLGDSGSVYAGIRGAI